jgi:hypothetical protein
MKIKLDDMNTADIATYWPNVIEAMSVTVDGLVTMAAPDFDGARIRDDAFARIAAAACSHKLFYEVLPDGNGSYTRTIVADIDRVCLLLTVRHENDHGQGQLQATGFQLRGRGDMPALLTKYGAIEMHALIDSIDFSDL